MKLKYLLSIVLLFGFCAMASQAFAQTDHRVSGTVTEAGTDAPLPGVNIVVQGQPERGTSTNINGEYSIQVAPDEVLVFSFLGFVRQEIPIDGRETIDVAMQEDIAELEGLVVIGYGVQQRGDNTGSVSTISSRDFNQGAITSPEDLFQGRSAGVNVTSNSGAPGAGATIRIRGGSSLSASNDPLYVVDGVPLDDGGIAGMRSPLNSINPNDIESITVLKDASATAIYGSRASNGVIIITTKRGESGQPLQVDYSGRFSYQTNTDRIGVLDADEYREFVEQSVAEGRISANALDILGDANTNWQDEIFRNAFSQDHNISVAGSYGDFPYRVSLGFSGNQGVLRTSSNDRLTGSVALTPTFFEDQLSVDLNFRGMRVDNRFADQGSIGSAISYDPTQPVRFFDEDGDVMEDRFGGYYTWLDADGNPISIAPSNPLSLINQRQDESTVYRSIGNLKLDYTPDFFPNLTATISAGYDYSDVGNGEVVVSDQAAFAFDGSGFSGERTDYDQRKENELLDIYFNYDTFLPALDSELDLTAGYSWEHHYERGSTFSTNFDRSADEVQVNTDTDYATEYYIVSFFGRANYSLFDRYLFTGTLRYDGTSRFSEDNRWGLFPSFAFAWKLHEENFLSDFDRLSELKLRLGYGVTGQQRIGQGNYPYLPQYTFSENTARYPFGNEFITTLRPEGYNAGLKWEETTTYNVGLDYSFNDEQIFGSVEYFYRQTDDLLNVIPVPAGTNFTNRILSNVGTLDVQGLEFDITTRLISTEDTFWQVTFNTTYTIDEITRLTTVDDPNYLGVEVGGIAGGTGNTVQVHSVGHPRSAFFVYEQVYDNDGNPIEGLYVDRNGDGVIDENDKYRFKSPNADWTFGLSSRYEYQNWDASFSARASFGNYVYNNVASDNAIVSQTFNNTGFLTNPTSYVRDTNFTNAQYRTDHFVEDGSFLRLDNVSVGYRFENLLNTATSMRVSATVQNVFTLTEYSGQDPEVFGGIDYNLYPRPRTFVLGLNLNF
ncbi:TonB-dependent receptor [Rhodohalobacter sp. SW132]|uniref:SusC/RagA family TonB-linked outer membrane protein n=1 Tax=Rhodohalobacter sp. SW132 TaxID=2293433 RepID=UPI000E2205FE|nr:TonB-dependent receptor [Rhodohalobacter sp. SW132]REL38289.1 TonB-dependent receptor [Rhodohalobacter sp. SW132]